MGIWGQDWASYQSDTPDTSGLAFAFVKVTQGVSYVNPRWTAQRDHAKAAGLVWGGYHYPDMGNGVQAEGNYFLSQVAWEPGDLAILDWEGYDTANSAVSKHDQAAYKEAWLRYVKSRLPHNPVGLYCDTDYWRTVDTTGYYGDFLWIATAGLPAGQPGIQAPWLFHQYSASGVDRDFCHLSTTQALRDWALSFSEADVPFTPADAQVLLDTKVPLAKLADGYVPSVAELLNGAKLADSLLTAQTAQIAALSAAVAALAKNGSLTAAEVQAAAQAGAAAALAQLGQVLQHPAAP
ncbi:glycoside hydrolase family 25 protein [Streptacidiphilus sp. EB129]|uniref:glycoside hydrolase family 25 protein n=1 Tax=Streptacidiphilus sp. EB129 TaxID=3156262 RepID=UPI003517AF6A